MTRVFLVLAVVAVALIVCLRIAGVIDDDVASDSVARALGMLAVLCAAMGAISFVARGRGAGSPGRPDAGPNQGPKF